MPTPFQPGKTAKELGIDLKRTFVNSAGEAIRLLKISENGLYGLFEKGGERWGAYSEDWIAWPEVAYADGQEPEAYVPAVGDRVSLEGTVRAVSVSPGWFSVLFDGSKEECVFEDDECKHAKLISRPKPKRRVTMEEVEKAFGEAVEIIGE